LAIRCGSLPHRPARPSRRRTNSEQRLRTQRLSEQPLRRISRAGRRPAWSPSVTWTLRGQWSHGPTLIGLMGGRSCKGFIPVATSTARGEAGAPASVVQIAPVQRPIVPRISPRSAWQFWHCA
jgi:hypothetical protein